MLLALLPMSASAEDAFDFRGMRLGSPLSEFRQKPFLDEYLQDGVRPMLFCTGDSGADPLARLSMPVSRSEEALGVIKCAWFLMPGGNRSLWKRARVLVGDYAPIDLTYSFIKAPDSPEPLLYQITTSEMSNTGFLSMLEALKVKLGEPSKREERQVQNRAGAIFNNTIVTWSNGVSSVRLEERYGRIDQMGLVYEHTALLRYYQSERRRLENPAGKL
jgi:hypothetical protein